MSQDWGKRTWADVLDIVNGKNQKAVENPNGMYPIYGSGGVIGFADDFLCEAGSTIIGRKGSINNPIYVEERFWNVDTAFGLTAKDGLDNRFLYYFCLSTDFSKLNKGTTLPSLTKRDLLTLEMPLPPLPEQQRIVAILDKAFEAIAIAKANAEKNLKNAKELLKSSKAKTFEELSHASESKRLSSVCKKIFAGGDAPKDSYSKEPSDKYHIPIYANAVKDKGLYGYTDTARVEEPAITVAGRGSGTGYTEIRNEPYYPIVRLISLIPSPEIRAKFLHYSIQNLEIMISGSAIPQLTVPMMKDYEIAVPALSDQDRIISWLDRLSSRIEALEVITVKKLELLLQLRNSILHQAFSGELATANEPVP